LRKSIFWVFFLFFLTSCFKSPPPEFDGESAFEYLEKQCDFGPRYPGSEAHQRLKKYLIDILKTHTDMVKEQRFSFYDSLLKKELNSTNIIASFYPEKKERILLCAHWDTRPFADEETQPELREKPVLGANDGASGVAVLLELASILSQRQPKWGVDIVLFDAEDYGSEERGVEFCVGSDYFAKNMGKHKPKFGILLDMIGDKNLEIYREGHSEKYAKEIVDLVWDTAEKLNLNCFRNSVKYHMIDDHISLLKAGIKCIDIIDFDYPYWHTTHDTPDKCSGESLEKVGRVLIKILYD